MALTCSSSIEMPIQKYGSFLKYPYKKLTPKRSHVPLKKASVLMITASIKNKVYEDLSQGIVCYRDERGEIICEGYDEGPCCHRITEPTNHPRDAQITNLLRQSLLQIFNGEKSKDDVEGYVQKYLNRDCVSDRHVNHTKKRPDW